MSIESAQPPAVDVMDRLVVNLLDLAVNGSSPQALVGYAGEFLGVRLRFEPAGEAGPAPTDLNPGRPMWLRERVWVHGRTVGTVCLQQEGPYEAWLPVLRRVAFLVGAALGQQSGGAGPVFGPGAELAQVLLSGQAHESALRARLALEQLRAGRWLAAVVGQVVFPQRGRDCDPARFLPDLQQEADRGLPAALPPDRSGVARLASALRGEHLILVLTADDPEHLRSGCRRLVERLVNRVRQLSPGLNLCAGVGALRQRLDSLRDAVGEALLVLRLRVAAGHDPRPLFFDDYPVPRFLLSVPPAELRDLVRRELAPLLTLPPDERDALLNTLEALLQFNWNISSAARHLHLARQSLYRRIQRLESLMGKDLDHSERRTVLLLALRARELVGF